MGRHVSIHYCYLEEREMVQLPQLYRKEKNSKNKHAAKEKTVFFLSRENTNLLKEKDNQSVRCQV